MKSRDLGGANWLGVRQLGNAAHAPSLRPESMGLGLAGMGGAFHAALLRKSPGFVAGCLGNLALVIRCKFSGTVRLCLGHNCLCFDCMVYRRWRMDDERVRPWLLFPRFTHTHTVGYAA